MKLDLRDRCERCGYVIRSNSKPAQANFARYKPYCGYHCQEWAKLEAAAKHLQKLRAAEVKP